tara:strand:- start:25 stop:207 length:183 start_codon:yes stop_codon:yes gene_type:complete
MKPLYIECQDCEATYQIKHDMSGEHYEVSFCSFCGEKLEDFYDPNQRELFPDEAEEEIEW